MHGPATGLQAAPAAAGAGHALHYALLVVSAVVVAWLVLAPAVAGRVDRRRRAQRVERLRASAQAGRLPADAARTARGASPAAAATAPLLPLAVVVSAAAGSVHLAATPAHAREGLALGAFFAAATLGQLGWSALVTRVAGRALLWAGLAGNLAVVALWTWTRTRGIPFGVGEGEVEQVGAWDLTSVLLELGVAALCALALRRGQVTAPRRADWTPPVRLLAACLALALLGLLVTGLPD